MATLAFSGLLAGVAPAASAAVFGTQSIPISVGPSGEPANGPSGGAAISGDNRKGRLVAFHSEASNLVGGDSNQASDVFVWSRPGGSAGLTLDAPARPAGGLDRVSVSSNEVQANGPSRSPSVDGSLKKGAKCVAFQSQASNLSPDDSDAVSDVFVRNLSAGTTVLVSRGIARAATDPSIDGSCRTVAFTAAGKIYQAAIRRGKPKSVGGGRNPDLSLDGTALVWERGGGIAIRRENRTSRVASGQNPTVTDKESGIWGVVHDFQDNVYTRTVRERGGARATDLISAVSRGGPSLGGQSTSGGITAYGARRGIIVFARADAAGASLFYRNNNTGNIDDLAHAPGGSITEVSTSARANFVAFSSTGTGFPFDGNGSTQDVFFKHLVDGEAL